MKTLYKLLNNNSNTILDPTNFNSLSAEICLDNNYIDYAYINGENHILSEIRDEDGTIGIFFKDIDMDQTEKSNIVTNILNISSITLSSIGNDNGTITIDTLGNPYNTLKADNNAKILLDTAANIKTSINSYELKNNGELNNLIPTSNHNLSASALQELILSDYELPNNGEDAYIKKIESDYTNITAANSKLTLSQSNNNNGNFLTDNGAKLYQFNNSNIRLEYESSNSNSKYIIKSESSNNNGTELDESNTSAYFKFDIGQKEFIESSSADAIKINAIKINNNVYKYEIICNELIETVSQQ